MGYVGIEDSLAVRAGSIGLLVVYSFAGNYPRLGSSTDSWRS